MRISAALFALLLWFGAAFAQGGMGPGPGMVHSAGGGGNINFTATANPAFQAGTANPQVFTSQAIGTADANRWVVVGIAFQDNGPATAVTIGGVSATKDSDPGGSNNAVELWRANVPTGTTATINITMTTASPTTMGIVVGQFVSATGTPNSHAEATAGRFAADPQTTSSALTINTNGAGIVVGWSDGNTNTPTWNVGTGDFSTAGTGCRVVFGHITATGSQTPSISNYNFASFSIASASYGP